MPKTQLIDERVSLRQCKLAIEALHAHELKKDQQLQESELLPGKEPNIWLNVTVKKIPSGHKFKPAKIPIAHPLIDPRTTPICLITKDPQREYKDLLEAHKIKFISRVVGVEKLKGKFKPFEARRMLLKENGLFLADERIIPLLPKLLGVKWFEAKKQPIPVCLKRKDLKGELERAVSSTYMNQNQGTCTSVKIAVLSHTPAQILANLKLALPAIAKHIAGGWENIQALHIKTNSSVSLPIWSCSLDESEGGRWADLVAKDEESEVTSDEEDEMVVEEKEQVAQVKGRKRTQEDEEPEKPTKKAKGAKGQPVAATESAAQKIKATAPPSADIPVETKPSKSKRKSAAVEAPAPTPTVESPDASSPSANKKRSKKSSTTTAVSEPEIVSSTPAPTTKATPKKDKAVKGSTQTPTSAPAPAASPAVFETKNQKKKKARLSSGLTSDPLPSAIPESASEKAAPTGEELPAKGKKGKKAEKTAEPPAEETPAPSLTQQELKQKRSGAPGEKKKAKVNAVVVGKSAKDHVLGKKAAQ
ncbi:hypothetical protein H0H81_002171 [Sphagnurus paluster]|uniref:Ribosomal L1 domain-containing protein 1 n=1 Tax=Sphagnurus paluster TaxID=117069 RepID=A0A9P7K2L5_9AGAR|nr:hypothetical protein H0H81_002171 [Sphagnurus paluster]